MVYERVQRSAWQSSSQKKQSKIVLPLIDEQIQADSQPSLKVNLSRLPSKEERDAIRRSLFEKWAKAPESLVDTEVPIQAKLTIGEPGDKYEQEADRVAAQVVNQINATVPQQSAQSQSLQREAIPEEDDLQMKPEVSTIHRGVLPDEELQKKPMVQLQSDVGGMTATPDLQASIQQALGNGQPLAENIREPMEQAFGSDFSGVKVHTDTQSDQINQSIQARSFTTGQDIFFRQGEYDPRSQGGQKLIAHELTHVMQQNGSAVQQAQMKSLRLSNSKFNHDYSKFQGVIGVSLGRANPDLLMRKIETKINGQGGMKYFAEAALEGSKKHGIKWNATEAYARAKADDLPQGKFGTKADVEAVVFAAAKYLGLGEQGIFNLPNGHNCIVYPVPTEDVPKPPTVPATDMYIKVYNNGKVHAYPYDSTSYTPAAVTSYAADYSDQATYI